jgi:hypothetical protein
MEGKEAESTGSDFVLGLLIGIVEGTEKSDTRDHGNRTIAITLNVGGLLVSGELISSKTYMNEFMGGALRDKIKSVLGDHDELRREVEDAPKGEDDSIHLRDARFLVPGQPPIPGVGDGVLWRGRVNSVEGFFLGRLGVAKGGDTAAS